MSERSQMSCVDENKVVEFIQGLLSPDARAQIEAHLDECASCRQLMAEVAKLSFASSSRRSPPLAEELLGTASLQTPSSSSELLPDQVLAGRFRIIRRLGRGSFGHVYEAQDLQLEERVALKLLRPEVRDNPGLLGHLHHEIVVGRRVSHPNVCRIYDLGTCDDIHFISMALIPGQGLDRYLEKGLPSVERAHSILTQICEALEAAHHQGVVHRDLKPSNIMVHEAADGQLIVTVMDFGLSRDLRAGPSMSGALIGSPAYWSPEQARGERATGRSDIYSLGLIGCDLFGVKHPAFGAVTGLEAVPVAYRAVLERCLDGDPEKRYGSPREVRNALVVASKHARIRRRRIRTIAVTALAALGGAASVLLLTFLRTPERSAPRRDHGPTAPLAKQGGQTSRDGQATQPHPATSRVATASAPDAGRRVPQPRASVVRPSIKEGRKGGKLSPVVAVAKTKHEPESTAARPDVGGPLPKPVSKASPKSSVLAAALRERLSWFEAERKRRGILIEDLSGGRGQRDEVRRAISGGSEAAAQAALSRLEQSLRQVKIDGNFVSRKLEGLNRAKRGMQLPEATEKKVSAIFAKVHDRFFSGDYNGANAQLNSIWRLLGRGD